MKMKIKNLKMDKKAQIGATLTWFAAFIIIFFIMLLFVAATTSMATWKHVSKNTETITLGYPSYSEKTTITLEVMDFLNKPVEGGYVKDLLIRAGEGDKDEEARIKIFKDEAGKLLENIFQGGTKNNPDYSTWMRLYPINEEIRQYTNFKSLAYKYEAARVLSAAPQTSLCSPFKNSENIISIPIFKDKKLVVCWSKG